MLELFGIASLLTDDVAAARAAAAELLPLRRQTDSMGWACNWLALLAARSGHCAAAANMLGHADAWFDAEAILVAPVDAYAANLAVATIDAALGRVERERLHCEGARLTAAQAHALAAEVLANADGDPASAAVSGGR